MKDKKKQRMVTYEIEQLDKEANEKGYTNSFEYLRGKHPNTRITIIEHLGFNIGGMKEGNNRIYQIFPCINLHNNKAEEEKNNDE